MKDKVHDKYWEMNLENSVIGKTLVYYTKDMEFYLENMRESL